MRDEESHTFFENLLVTFGKKANGSEAAFLNCFSGVNRYPRGATHRVVRAVDLRS